jgi:pre-mRNA-splicing factor SYF1
MERKLGEIDRARAIYVHCSQICDPKTSTKFWQIWREFEIGHGNEDTVREMLRIKRSVQATYNVQVNFMSAQMISSSSSASNNKTPSSNISKENNDPMSNLEAKAAQLAKQVIADSKNREIKFIKFVFFSI